jgi:hypothetical protein
MKLHNKNIIKIINRLARYERQLEELSIDSKFTIEINATFYIIQMLLIKRYKRERK